MVCELYLDKTAFEKWLKNPCFEKGVVDCECPQTVKLGPLFSQKALGGTKHRALLKERPALHGASQEVWFNSIRKAL